VSTVFAILAGVLPPVIIVLAIILKVGIDSGFDFGIIIIILILSFVALSGFGVPFAWKTHWVYGLVYGLLIYAFLGFTAFELFSNKFETPVWLDGTLLAGLLICLSASIPISILPIYRGEPILTKRSSAQIKDTIDASAIAEKLSELQNVLDNEGKKIEHALDSAIEEVEAQNKQLSLLRNEKDELKRELDTYKNLLNLSKKQIEAITSVLNRGQYLDYIIGFILGVISSFIVTLAPRLMPRKPNK